MSKLLAAWKKRFRTPAEAMAAMGLDASLLDPDEPNPTPVIAHDWDNHTNRRTPVTRQEERLMAALRRRFRGGPVAVLRRLGMDQAELEPPSDDEPGDAVSALLQQFEQLSDEDKASFVEAISQMATNPSATDAGFSARGRPHAMDARSPIGSFAQRFPHAAKIGNGFG